MLTNVHKCIIHNSEKIETNQMSIDKKDKQIVVYLYSGILFTYKKECILRYATIWIYNIVGVRH